MMAQSKVQLTYQVQLTNLKPFITSLSTTDINLISYYSIPGLKDQDLTLLIPLTLSKLEMLLEVPHFASVRGGERELIVLR